MDSQIFTNTGIIDENWNPYSTFRELQKNRAFARTDHGVLFALVITADYNSVNVMGSTDDGFTWQKLKTLFISPIQRHLHINEWLQQLTVVYSRVKSAGKYQPGFFSYKYTINDNGIITLTNALADTGWFDDRTGTYGDESDYNHLESVCTNNNIRFINLNTTGALRVLTADWDSIETVSPTASNTTVTTYKELQAATVLESQTLGILTTKDVSGTKTIEYIDTVDFATDYTVRTYTTTVSHLNICQDGYGTLLAYWSEIDASDNTISHKYYSISTDDGATWSSPTDIITSTSANTYSSGGDYMSFTNAEGCIGGFILSYIAKDAGGRAVAYVKLLTSPNGSSYTLGSQKIAASHPSKDVIGINFFLPSNAAKLDINTPAEIRFAYQVGYESTSNRIPVFNGQKLLKDEAFPDPVSQTFSSDTLGDGQLLGTFTIFNSFTDNVDYYVNGLKGYQTEKYLSAFTKHGTSVKLTQYDPIQESKTSDRDGYEEVSSGYYNVFIDSIAYSSPVSSGTETFDQQIERDTRQVHLPPNKHLERTIIRNDGNHIKRTVWIMDFGGNKYELTQVVPYIINNQILYYTANAYVVGPTRNPFTRNVLPSET